MAQNVRTARGSQNMLQPLCTEKELAGLGEGEVVYIHPLTFAKARDMFPTVEGLPEGLDLFGVFSASGVPLGLTDTLAAACDYVHDNGLLIVAWN